MLEALKDISFVFHTRMSLDTFNDYGFVRTNYTLMTNLAIRVGPFGLAG